MKKDNNKIFPYQNLSLKNIPDERWKDINKSTGVNLQIMDIAGQVLETIANERQVEGKHELHFDSGDVIISG